jgi:hypothetical protein
MFTLPRNCTRGVGTSRHPPRPWRDTIALRKLYGTYVRNSASTQIMRNEFHVNQRVMRYNIVFRVHFKFDFQRPHPVDYIRTYIIVTWYVEQK